MNDVRSYRTRGPAPATFAALAVALLAGLGLAYALWSQRAVTIFEGASPFGRVHVTERADGLRALYLGPGRARQSAIYPGRPAHLEHAYTRVAMVGLALAPDDPRLLFVGLGGGAMPMYTREMIPEARIDVVEIDSLVVDVAKRYFAFTPDARLHVHVADGRSFIERAAPGSWNVAFLDAFSDDAIPRGLTTREFLVGVRRALAADGVVVSNLWTSHAAYPSMVATYQAVFAEVALLRVQGRAQALLVATSDAGRLDREGVLDAARRLADRVDLGFDLRALMAAGYTRPPAPTAPVLEDSR